ncbi:MAG: phage portal protein, partial [Candidatus Neomarinimicrobiota bacterium]
MTTIISETNLITMPANWWTNANNITLSSVRSDYTFDYLAMYKNHMNVRICVDFLARNIAHLGLHVYTRKEDNDRERVRDHRAVQVLKQPLPTKFKVTQFQLVESAVADMLISGNGYLLKHRNGEGEIIALQRVPYMLMSVKGELVPTKYKIGYIEKEYKPEDIIHFRFYNPENSTIGVSPLEGLREVLAEEWEKSKYSSGFWRNAARISGVIERPLEAKEMSEAAARNFRQQWQEMYAGEDNSGKTALLEEGMVFKPMSFSPKETEYIESRKLNREECARAYHIPPPMVGILDRSTFSNITELHKSLYMDVLSPMCARLEDDWDLQYLSEFKDLKGAYTEFNIDEKLQSDFSMQLESLRQSVGVPYMTPNEGRAILNLPRLKNPLADTLVTPLNMATPEMVMQQQQNKSEMPIIETKASAESIMPEYPDLDKDFGEKWHKLMVNVFTRQRDAVLPKAKMDKLDVLWDKERWDREVSEDFLKLAEETAWAYADAFAGQLGAEYKREWMEKWLQENARIAAEYINASTYDQLAKAMQGENPVDAIKEVFASALAVRAVQLAEDRCAMVESYVEAKIADAVDSVIGKIWTVRSNNPRPEHEKMNGEFIEKREVFSNGLQYPRSYKGSAKDNANCKCKVTWV